MDIGNKRHRRPKSMKLDIYLQLFFKSELSLDTVEDEEN